MKPQTVAIIGLNRTLLAELNPMVRRELPGANVVEIDRYPEAALFHDMASDPPVLVLIEVSEPADAAMDAIQMCARTLHGVPVMAVMKRNDPEFILRCLRLGASEFLLHPIAEPQMKAACDRLLQLRRGGMAGRSGGRVYCVVPVKGACGATTLAANLPVCIKRNGFERVLLCDMDPVTGTIAFQMKVKSQYSFVDAISHRHGLDDDMWKGLVATHNGVDVLLAPDQPGDVSAGIGELGGLVDFCRGQYEAIVLDTGNPYSPWTMELTHQSDEILLVTTNELTALRSAQRVLANFGRNRVDRSKVKLIVNRYNTEIGLNQEAIETALRCDVFHVIPSDYESVNEALVSGKPIAISTSFGKSVTQLAERLAGVKESPKKTAAKTARVTGFFTSMFTRSGSSKG
jgi:pilus assembly protein CpaE